MLRTWISRIRGALFRRRMEQEFAGEIETHLSLLEDELVGRGMPRAQARLEARRQFGGVTQVRELHREGRGLAHLERSWTDLVYALRMMLRNPGFTAVAVATLALGIGVNTALFSAYNAVALKPWPVADPGRVVRLERWFESRNLGDAQYAFSYPEYLYLRGHAGEFAAVLATLALLLAGVGIYGVMAYLVSQRTREIGIRMALGAASGQVVRDVLSGGLRPVVVGMAVGIAGAAGASALLHSTLSFPGSADLLYGVSFYDPATFLGLSAFLLAVAAAASALPARRAVKVDPMVALRYD